MAQKNGLLGYVMTVLSLAAMQGAAAYELSGSAFVQDDGSLVVTGQRIYLYGIYIPPTEQSCSSFIRPMPCAPRAALALDFRVSGNSVHCTPRTVNPDGSLVASCRADDEDLSAWMLQRGWAVARPDAPFEYAALERIARAKGIGIWGIAVDVPPPRVPRK